MNRTRQAKWDANYMTTISTKFPAMEVESIDRMIADAGFTSRYAFLQYVVNEWCKEYCKEAIRKQIQGNYKIMG